MNAFAGHPGELKIKHMRGNGLCRHSSSCTYVLVTYAAFLFMLPCYAEANSGVFETPVGPWSYGV
jgi:hypothetical protein